MRVCYLTPTYFSPESIIGGGERYAYELARAMARYVETELIAFGPRVQHVAQGRMHVRILKGRFLAKGDPLSGISPALVTIISKADVIHCHQLFTPMSDIALVMGKLLGKKVFITPHGGGSWSIGYHVNVGRLATGFLHVCQYSASQYAKHSSRHAVIYGGADPDWFAPGSNTGQREGLLFVGRLLPWKGVEYLIQAVPRNVLLRIVGPPYDPDYLARLHRLAEGKRVEFVLDASQDQLRLFYQSSRMLVIPSVSGELLPLVLYEAMASGLPVICTRIGGLPEVVEEGVMGFLVPPGDPDTLRDRIEWLLAHPREAEEMGRAGRQLVLERFTWEKVAERCLRAYS